MNKLHVAVQRNDYEATREALKDASIRIDSTAMFLAIENMNPAIIKLLYHNNTEKSPKYSRHLGKFLANCISLEEENFKISDKDKEEIILLFRNPKLRTPDHDLLFLHVGDLKDDWELVSPSNSPKKNKSNNNTPSPTIEAIRTSSKTANTGWKSVYDSSSGRHSQTIQKSFKSTSKETFER